MINFKSLRHKLLFWFLVFVSSNLVIIVINFTYLDQRERIAGVFRLLEETHKELLEDHKNQLNFFTLETKNRVFFEFGSSKFIDSHKSIFEAIERKLRLLSSNSIIHQFALDSAVQALSVELYRYDSLFIQITELIKQRGFKDYNAIGEMREAAHALEQLPNIDPSLLLTMRRHEKDFLLRHENIYLRKLNNASRELEAAVERSAIGNNQKQISKNVLQSYQLLFRKVVDLDRQIGLYDNSGLKAELDQSETALTSQFASLLQKAEQGREEQFAKLKVVTIVVITGFILFGIWMSFVISRRITYPLTDLTSYITKFVGSNFTFVNEQSGKLTKDEIGRLTLNFNVMRDKIIEQLQFFKEKVDERTVELAEANDRLIKINEANRRFVPNEFLHYLNKESIEEVHLGDNVARKMTIVFSDIRGFTKVSEGMTPQENFDFINDYLHEIVPHVREHNGFVDKYIGDSVMALFAEQVDHAIDCSIESMKSVRSFNRRREQQGKGPIRVGIGVHTGNLILGTIGEENRMETTVISDAVNTASRMEGLTSIYGGNILISGAVYNDLTNPEKYHIRYLDTVMVKGKEKAVKVFEVLDGLREQQLQLKLTAEMDFQNAITHYGDKSFVEAKRLFEKVTTMNPEDKAAALYVSRCQTILDEGVPDNWEAIQKLTSKS